MERRTFIASTAAVATGIVSAPQISAQSAPEYEPGNDATDYIPAEDIWESTDYLDPSRVNDRWERGWVTEDGTRYFACVVNTHQSAGDANDYYDREYDRRDETRPALVGRFSGISDEAFTFYVGEYGGLMNRHENLTLQVGVDDEGDRRPERRTVISIADSIMQEIQDRR